MLHRRVEDWTAPELAQLCWGPIFLVLSLLNKQQFRFHIDVSRPALCGARLPS